ncbi:MAG: winged helix-turn-helix transcriptional regulator, partial [Rhizobiales bacterium]|nr:winged helix-turn-helix transcriptional regulator [Hyphomicrobiales bacterium]
MTTVPEALVSRVRSSSRQLVRELGFMGKTLAGTNLPASAVHAIIEIGTTDGLTAKQLSDKLLLEKSTVSRLLKGLKTRGEIAETRSEIDARAKRLALTPQGEQTLKAIVAFAGPRVSNALSRLGEGQRAQVSDALEAYANALAQCRAGAT